MCFCAQHLLHKTTDLNRFHLIATLGVSESGKKIDNKNSYNFQINKLPLCNEQTSKLRSLLSNRKPLSLSNMNVCLFIWVTIHAISFSCFLFFSTSTQSIRFTHHFNGLDIFYIYWDCTNVKKYIFDRRTLYIILSIALNLWWPWNR